MWAVILKSDRNIAEIPISLKLGIDIRKDIETGNNNYETFENNYGKGKTMGGGPTCRYLGKEIPCFVGFSPKAYITSEMLAAMLEIIENQNVFDRANGE
jgi:hypothetical protein